MNIISGGISGAITDPYSEEAENHAALYYKEIREFNTDVNRIAQNTGYILDQIKLVKDYLFVNEHLLEGEFRRFDPSFEIAESWRRLAFDPKSIKPHDLTLLRHELKEIELVSRGISQNEAHKIASAEYNCSLESENYYKSLSDKKDEKSKGKSRKSRDEWER